MPCQRPRAAIDRNITIIDRDVAPAALVYDDLHGSAVGEDV
jgi:hypothetical protein